MAVDPFFKLHDAFRKRINSWALFTKRLSPASLDFEERVRAKWHEEQVSLAFARLEDRVTAVRGPDVVA